ncbi:MAG: hypothetical protein E7004_06275 [Alphaproteobacteria bacterium]|nr:hypothetical protein [Alphaproteobacteria bacterium]
MSNQFLIFFRIMKQNTPARDLMPSINRQNNKKSKLPAWDLKSLYPNEEELLNDKDRIYDLIASLTDMGKKLELLSPIEMANFLEIYTDILETADRIYDYASAKMSENRTDPENQKLHEEANEIFNDSREKTSWIYAKLVNLPYEVKIQFLTSPFLQDYQSWLFQTVWRNPEISKYMGRESYSIQSMASNWSDLYYQTFADFKFEIDGEEYTYSQIAPLRFNKDQKLAIAARRALNEKLEEYKNIFAKTLSSLHQLNDRKVDIEIGDGMISSADALDLNAAANHLDVTILNKMQSCITDVGYELSKEFYELMGKMLNVEKMSYFDVTKNPAKKGAKPISWDYCQKLFVSLLQVLHPIEFNPFDDQHRIPMASYGYHLFKSKLIHAMELPHKDTCAYCSNTYPFRVFLDEYDDNLASALTVFHEGGHFIHHNVMYNHSIKLNYGSPASKSEICSLFMEGLLFHNLLANKKLPPIERLYILIEYANHLVSSIQRQTAFHLFEKTVFTRKSCCGHISADNIKEIFTKEMSRYLGFKLDDEAQNDWMRIPHFFGSRPFYVQYYSFSALVANRLWDVYQSGKLKDFGNRYYNFMRWSGEADFDQLLNEQFGIDISDEKTWYDAMSPLKDTIKEIKVLGKKLGFLK